MYFKKYCRLQKSFIHTFAKGGSRWLFALKKSILRKSKGKTSNFNFIKVTKI